MKKILIYIFLLCAITGFSEMKKKQNYPELRCFGDLVYIFKGEIFKDISLVNKQDSGTKLTVKNETWIKIVPSDKRFANLSFEIFNNKTDYGLSPNGKYVEFINDFIMRDDGVITQSFSNDVKFYFGKGKVIDQLTGFEVEFINPLWTNLKIEKTNASQEELIQEMESTDFISAKLSCNIINGEKDFFLNEL